MGLMVSVLVFFVGVVEVLDCWHHFLLHLINPSQKAISCQTEPKLTARGHPTPVEFRRPSHVDICWPKDLSPTDDLHIIKKRPHLESERSFEHDDDLARRRSKGKISHHEEEPDRLDLPSGSIPQIVVHWPDAEDPSISPTCSGESSPNYLELSVIVESDSSSDEPSQIENPAYKKRIEAESASSSLNLQEELVEHSKVVSSNPKHDFNNKKSPMVLENEDETTIPRPGSPYPLSEEYLNENVTVHSEVRDVENSNRIEESLEDLTDLPIFTDNIVSKNVTKVSCRYAPNIVHPDCSLLNNFENSSVDVNASSNYCDNPSIMDKPKQYENEPANLILKNTQENLILQDLSLSVKDQQPVPDCPGITLLESSPVPDDEDTDSSLNTSDASWMVKSRASERPLKIRFSPSPEDIAREFISVTKVDLKALGSSKTKKLNNSYNFKYNYEQAPLELQLDVAKVVDDIIEMALAYLPKPKLHDHDLLNGCEKISNHIAQHDKYCETSSSSSSLSGIPQLPEDLKDPLYLNLPTHNGFSTRNLENDSLETSYSIYDNFGSFTESNENRLGLVRTRSSEFVGGEILVNNFAKTLLTHSNSSPVIHSPHDTASEYRKQVSISNEEVVTSIPHTYLTDRDRNKDDGITFLPKQEKNTLKDISESSEPSKSIGKLEAVTDSSKDQKSKSSDDLVLLCKAKETKQSGCGKVTPLVSTGPLPGPGPSACEAVDNVPSTSKADNPEDKAFWLIFSGEYTKAMNKDWHSGHFCCWQCDESLTGQRYVLRDEHPYCIKCYESVFANGCEECSKTIGIDSKDLSYKDKHWHEACFLCNKCRVSLVDKQFGSKLDKIFCGNCYDAQFASRCDGCGQIFKAGTKKMEYKTRQWHEPCFACCVCKSPIGTKSFIPREQEIYCATCYEEKFATRCVKCNKIITSGGVTYKNEPWHRECFTCTNCNTSLAGQRFTSKEEKPYCADCFGELFAKRCTACSKPITGIGGTRFVSFEDRHWHNDCFSCASCKTSLVGRGFITDGDDIICPECAKQKLM